MDRTLGWKGYILSDIEDGSFTGISGIFHQDDGKVIAAAETHTAEGYDFSLSCYRWSGLLDRGFGENGRLRTNLFDGKQSHSNAEIKLSFSTNNCDILTKLQSPGKMIIVCNISDENSSGDIMLERYQF